MQDILDQRPAEEALASISLLDLIKRCKNMTKADHTDEGLACFIAAVLTMCSEGGENEEANLKWCQNLITATIKYNPSFKFKVELMKLAYELNKE